MTTDKKITAIEEFIAWREEVGDVSALVVSLNVYAEHLRDEERRTAAVDALDELASFMQAYPGAPLPMVDKIRTALEAVAQ